MNILAISLIALLAIPVAAEPTAPEVVAAVIMGEARGEGLDGMKAVAEVIRNRGGDPLKTVTKRKQFSCLNGRDVAQFVQSMKSKAGWSVAYRLASVLYNNPADIGNITKGANHYHALGCSPYWADESAITCRIGRHIFYRL